MFLKLESNVVNIKNQNADLKIIIDQLSKLSGKELGLFFQRHHLLFPRVVRIKALREVLDLKLSSESKLLLTDDEKHKLFFYENFSEYQLEKLFDKLCNQEMILSYKKSLMLGMLKHFEEIKLSDEVINTLLNLIPSGNAGGFMEYNQAIFLVTYDEMGFVDGLGINEFNSLLLQSATISDIRNLGKKYGVVVPRRLKKDDVLEIIYANLKNIGEYDEKIAFSLQNMPISLLNDFATKKNMPISLELKKEELVDYLLHHILSSNLYQSVEPETQVTVIEDATKQPVLVAELPIQKEINIDATFNEEDNKKLMNLINNDLLSAKRLSKLSAAKDYEDEIIERHKAKNSDLDDKYFNHQLKGMKTNRLRVIKNILYILCFMIFVLFIWVMVDTFTNHQVVIFSSLVDFLEKYVSFFIDLAQKCANLILDVFKYFKNL